MGRSVYNGGLCRLRLLNARCCGLVSACLSLLMWWAGIGIIALQCDICVMLCDVTSSIKLHNTNC